jgi:hypothetical protein
MHVNEIQLLHINSVRQIITREAMRETQLRAI